MSKEDYDKIKKNVNERHVQIYNKLLDNVEFLLDGFSRGIINSEYELTEVPKTAIATLDFLVSSIVKIQKGHRVALGLDDDSESYLEPQISVIQRLDLSQIRRKTARKL